MDKLMTDQDIVRLGKAVEIKFSAAEIEPMQAHIQKQLHSFEALNDIDTDGVEPTFDLQGEGRFMVGRRCE
ncbi:MAG: aspartyl/glutamyl-tRNA amidotransferase subunit C [Clostridiales bacterium]|nr:aspartyl/glutamyl-tRNA amidotransferase subunit C [Clostridiales bacterium]